LQALKAKRATINTIFCKITLLLFFSNQISEDAQALNGQLIRTSCILKIKKFLPAP